MMSVVGAPGLEPGIQLIKEHHCRVTAVYQMQSLRTIGSRSKQDAVTGAVRTLIIRDPWQFTRCHEVEFYAFDILVSDGEDLRGLPLSMRKASLARLLARRVDGIFLSDFEQGEIGQDLFRHPRGSSPR
jgi:hypothetical protein